MAQVKDINSTIDDLTSKVSTHEQQIVNIQAITTLGFIIALITLAGVVIAALAFVVDEVHQTNEQTKLLQEIKDKSG
jgi:hypothetical protein